MFSKVVYPEHPVYPACSACPVEYEVHSSGVAPADGTGVQNIMKVTAIIQARMTSTRLPGKVLLEVMGKTLLHYLIENLGYSKRISEVILATTRNNEDNSMAEFAMKKGLRVYRGSEHDVLDRFYQAAVKYGSEHIMRFTADCPLVQPHICDHLVDAYFDFGCDYARTGQTFAEGIDCEILSRGALEKAWKQAVVNYDREHVTLYIRNRPEQFNIRVIENDTDDSKYRITIDEQADFRVVEAIIENLYEQRDPYIRIEDIKRFLDSHPEIYFLNVDIPRNEGLLKSLQQEAPVK